MQIGLYDLYRSCDERFHFRLIYPDLGNKYNEWTQATSPKQKGVWGFKGKRKLNILKALGFVQVMVRYSLSSAALTFMTMISCRLAHLPVKEKKFA